MRTTFYLTGRPQVRLCGRPCEERCVLRSSAEVVGLSDRRGSSSWSAARAYHRCCAMGVVATAQADCSSVCRVGPR